MNDYIWIARWEDFQHYAPRRGRGPAWIKDYTAQLDDQRYLDLTDRQRALLQDLRRIFAVAFPWLPRSTAVVSRHRHRQTFRSDLEALNHAGFIEFISRESLEHRLEKLYSRSRSRTRDTPKAVSPLQTNEQPEPEPAWLQAEERPPLATYLPMIDDILHDIETA